MVKKIMDQNYLEDTKRIKAIFVGVATGGNYNDKISQNEYNTLREKIISNSDFDDLIPELVKSCRLLSEFWGEIKTKFSTYQERRNYLKKEFNPLLTKLESQNKPNYIDQSTYETLKKLTSQEILAQWNNLTKRKNNDPEGALTLSRTILESVIKHILDDLDIAYANDIKFSPLYNLLSRSLELSPSNTTNSSYKKIFSSVHNIVQGLGEIRNKLSDSHGTGRNASQVSEVEAELCINMSSSLSIFLIKKYEEKKP